MSRGQRGGQVRYLLIIAFVMVAISGFAAPALALSVSPASRTFAYNASGVEQYDLTVRNDEQRVLVITLTPTGPLADRITVPTTLTLQEGESRTLGVRLRMPDVTQPGVVESGILVESRPPGGGTVSASSAVLHVLRVRTPQYGAYLSGSLLSSSGIVGSEVLVTLSLANVGTQTVTTTPSLFLDGANQNMGTVIIAPGETRDLVAHWTPRSVGVYTASVSYSYADKENRLSTSIMVGNLSVILTDIGYGTFRLGEPFRVSIGVLNEWAADLPVGATVRLTQANKTISETELAPRSVAPLAEERLTAFLESAGATAGDGNIVVVVRYADHTLERIEPVVLGVDTVVARGAPIGSPGLPGWSIAVLVLTVAAVAAYFIYRRRTPR